MRNMVRLNSLKAWVLAARPKTLAGAATPVIMGGGCAWMWMEGCGMSPAEAFDWAAFALCMLFAWIMQVDANFVNDYFDFRKGGDTERRLGPKRACAQGWITPKAMRTGIIVTTVLACAAGLPLIWAGGPWMIAVGAACVLFCFLYTTKFSRLGLGDVLVLVFFGIVPVGFTFYLQTGTWDLQTTSTTTATAQRTPLRGRIPSSCASEAAPPLSCTTCWDFAPRCSPQPPLS